MKRFLLGLALIAGAAIAFGPEDAEARQRAPSCTTPKAVPAPPVAYAPPAPVQYAAPVPVQTVVAPPTYAQTPDTTVVIPGQTVTFTTPDQTVVVPGSRVEVAGPAYTLQAAVPLATPVYAPQPVCQEEPERPGVLRTLIEQRRLKREKHLGMEEPAPQVRPAEQPTNGTSACKGKCRKRLRGWEAETAVV